MKAYKLEILIIDFDELGEQGIRENLACVNFPNDCISLEIKSIEGRDIGEWEDAHPLNCKTTWDAEYSRLFKESN